MLLDIGLPDIDGFEVCERIRHFSDVPIMMLSARHEEVDKVRGLELGADDYVTKPFSHIELLARVRAVLRRSESQEPTREGPPFDAPPLFIDYASRQVRVDGQDVKITPIEAQGGRIWVENCEDGPGARFCIEVRATGERA